MVLNGTCFFFFFHFGLYYICPHYIWIWDCRTNDTQCYIWFESCCGGEYYQRLLISLFTGSIWVWLDGKDCLEHICSTYDMCSLCYCICEWWHFFRLCIWFWIEKLIPKRDNLNLFFFSSQNIYCMTSEYLKSSAYNGQPVVTVSSHWMENIYVKIP